MDFWQRNKPFAIVASLAALGLLVLWPSLFSLGPTVISFHRGRYRQAMLQHRSIEGKVKKLFPEGARFVPVARLLKQVTASNAQLEANIARMASWMSFVPRYPFRIPERREGNERKRYVSLVYTYARTGELQCDECSITDPSDGVVWLASTRNIPLRDPFFGMQGMELPEGITDPKTRIKQIALVHELGHLAIRLNVDEIVSITPTPPYLWTADEVKIAEVFPLEVEIRCDLPTLFAFLHALEGAHGRVVKVITPEKPEDAIRPVVAAAPAGPEDDPEENLAPRRTEAPTEEATRVVIELAGSPSFLDPSAKLGTLKERFTIVRPTTKGEERLTFVANAIVTKVLDRGRASLEPNDVRDWRSLCSRIASQGQSGQRSPGKRLWELLPLRARAAVNRLAASQHEPDPADQSVVIAAINAILRNRDFYSQEDFQGVQLPTDALALLRLDRSRLDQPQVQALNRLLLEAAFEREVARRATRLEAIIEPHSECCFPKDKPGPVRQVVQENDIAVTRFFFVRSIDARAVETSLKRDRSGFPTEMTPPHLVAKLSVAALQFKKFGVTAATLKKRRPTGKLPVIHRRL